MMDAVQRYLAPTGLLQALAALDQPGGVTVLAGGTDLMPQGRAGRVPPAGTLLNIRRVEGLDRIEVDGGMLVLGTLACIADLQRDPLVQAHAPLLAQVADCFASAQVRNAATLGGNLCNASPAGDMLPALLALDAEVELASLGPDCALSTRRLALDGFFTGPGRTQRAPNELLTAVRVPLAGDVPVPPGGDMPVPLAGDVRVPLAGDLRMAMAGDLRVERFYKAGTRPALDISPVAIAFAARRDAEGRLHGVRLALGAVGPTPMRARRAEALLEGARLDGPLAAEAGQVVAAEATPIDDVRASAWYRRELLRNMTQRMLSDVADQ